MRDAYIRACIQGLPPSAPSRVSSFKSLEYTKLISLLRPPWSDSLHHFIYNSSYSTCIIPSLQVAPCWNYHHFCTTCGRASRIKLMLATPLQTPILDPSPAIATYSSSLSHPLLFLFTHSQIIFNISRATNSANHFHCQSRRVQLCHRRHDNITIFGQHIDSIFNIVITKRSIPSHSFSHFPTLLQ